MESSSTKELVFYISDVLSSAAGDEDRERYVNFATFLEDWIVLNGSGIFSDSLLPKYKFHDLFKAFQIRMGYDIIAAHKDSVELHGYWVVFFRIMRKMIPNSQPSVFHFKYETSEDFLRAYNYSFIDLDQSEIVNLFFTANWMSLLFGTVDPRGNKGLAMSVIPKVIEGFHIKYSTGGGQSAQTAARVRIYETEGMVRPHERPTRKSMAINATSGLINGKGKGYAKDDQSIESKPQPVLFKRSFTTSPASTEASGDEASEMLAKMHKPLKRMSIGPGTFSSSPPHLLYYLSSGHINNNHLSNGDGGGGDSYKASFA